MKRMIAVIVSISIMALILMRIDTAELMGYFEKMDKTLFTLAMLLFIPQIAVSAHRWQVMIKKRIHIGFWEATKLMLSCNALNILLPSRIGDLSKAYFMSRENKLDMKRGMNTVVFEKYLDLTSFGMVLLTGILLTHHWDLLSLAGIAFSMTLLAMFPVIYIIDIHWLANRSFLEKHKILRKVRSLLLDSHEYLMEIKNDRSMVCYIICISIFLWFLHLLQFYAIFRALHSAVPMFVIFKLVPMAILAGLIPLTIAGIGTRDSALIYLFSPFEDPALIVGVGLFATLRYVIPGLLGLPFLNRYMVKKVQSLRGDNPVDGG